MLTMLLAYNAAGDVIATLSYMVMRDEGGDPIGLVDFDAHEQAGGELTDVWTVDDAAGSKTWPEWLGGRASDFRVELAGPPGRKRIVALVHKTSGHRRERAAVETAIAERVARAVDETADIRDIVGGPDRPLVLGDDGRKVKRVQQPPSTLPVVALGSGG